MCMCAYPFLPSIVIISLQTFFQFNFFAMTWMPQKHVKHQTLQATNTFFVLKKKKNSERMYKYVRSYFCKPKVLQCF